MNEKTQGIVKEALAKDENDDIFKGYEDAKEYFWCRLIKMEENRAWEEDAVIEGKVHQVSKRELVLFPVTVNQRLRITCHATQMPDAGDEYKLGFVNRLSEVCPVSLFFVAFRFANDYGRTVTRRTADNVESEAIRRAAAEKDLSGFLVSADASQVFVFNSGVASLGETFGKKS